MFTDINKIKVKLSQHRGYLKKTYNVEDIGVFGSVARGDNKVASDIDTLVSFSKPVGFFKFIELENYLTVTLGAKVDLVTKKALKPAIRDEILQETVYV